MYVPGCQEALHAALSRRGFFKGAAAASSVLGLAVDTLSFDNGPSKDFKTHHIWLLSGRWGLENAAKLEKLPPSAAVLAVGLPKVKGSTGGPVRLIALI